MPIYLDYNATAPIRPQVRAAMLHAMEEPANPSSVHGYGRAAKKKVEDARAVIGEALSVFPHEVIFTATGTEANTLALKGLPDRDLIISSIEHASVIKTAGEPVKVIPVWPSGVIDLDALDEMLAKTQKPALISVMLANNETGVIQPIAEIAAKVHAHDGLLHTDAIQAVGKIPVDAGLLGADMVSISAHKFGGPQGIAALIVRQPLELQKLMVGGGQELGRRAGTENVAAITGFATAIQLIAKDTWQKPIRDALDTMEQTMLAQVPGAQVLGKDSPRLPNTSSILMPKMKAETQLMHFDLAGFAISAGSACSSGRIEPSHVAKAMKVSDETADHVIRVSAGWNTNAEDIQKFTDVWLKLAASR
ncbi:MAG: cysteine desulfurase family protein [Rickettsiales bacterium]